MFLWAAALIIVATVAALVAVFVLTLQALSVGLPDVASFESLSFAQPTTVYDSSGKVLLTTFELQDRRVVTFDEVPKLVLDATTGAEDRTFWDNPGYDPLAIVAAFLQDTGTDATRGASTITQQLVRARLLPKDLLQPGANQYIRKAKEIIQAARLTAAFPGQAGKDRIITAYLNQIFYGHGAYGIAAAAKIYFGIDDLSQLTPSQAALLAGLPKSPTSLDPYVYAKKDAQGRLVVPPGSPPMVRRDWVLQSLASGRWTHLTPAQLQAAITEPVILSPPPVQQARAPQFDLQVKAQLASILGSQDAVETGGYRVITTLDWNAQQLAEKWLTAAVIAPNLPRSEEIYLLDQLKIPQADRAWIQDLVGKDVHDGALIALDYRTGDVLAYVGSAGFYRSDLASPKFSPQFDVLADGPRQPGSAWKPILYSTAFQQHVLTPGSVLLDIQQRFAPTWAPHDADLQERGPVLVRKALQYSLNIPAIRTLQLVGDQAVATQAEAMGIHFMGGTNEYLNAGLAGAIGTVEVTPFDLTSAFGTLADGGVRVPPRMILEVDAPDGQVVYRAPDPATQAVQALSPQAAFLTTDIIAGNTDPSQNPMWSAYLELTNGPDGERRPAAVKTGTSDETQDLSTYGYLAPPADPTAPAVAVGVWMGNSDHSTPAARNPAVSFDGPARIWHAFVQDLSDGWPVADFVPPSGVVRATIDAWSGGAPGPWTRQTTQEWFIDGTQPGAPGAIDPPGLIYTYACGAWEVDPVKAERGPAALKAADEGWTARARAGPGVRGPLGSRTAYFFGRYGWGGPIVGTCAAPVAPPTTPTPLPSAAASGAPTPAPSSGPRPTPSSPPAPAPSPTPQRPKPSPSP
jgi:membrane peptidoglycan carboxypeptidase